MKRDLPPNLKVDNTIGSQIQSIVSQRKDHVVQITQPSRQFQESALQTSMNGQKGQLNSLIKGPSFSRFYPFTSGNFFDQFKINNYSTKPELISKIPLSELTSNYTHPINRRIAPYMDNIECAGAYELSILYKDDPLIMDTMEIGQSGPFQPHPLSILNPASFNHALYNMQTYDVKKKGIDFYKQKEPWDYWKKFSFDGIIEFERMDKGYESTYSSGVLPYVNNNQNQNSGGIKRVTTTAMGPQFVYNYWGSNIKPGGKCYAIIKKHALTVPTFNLSNKQNISSITGLKKVEPVTVLNNIATNILPYQMSFVCLPNGGLLPQEATMYYNEDGDIKYDGIAIYLGKIWSVPIDHVFRPIKDYNSVEPIMDRNIQNVPYTDSNVGVDRESIMLMKLIFDCDDGISPL